MSYKDLNLLLTHQILSLDSADGEEEANKRTKRHPRGARRSSEDTGGVKMVELKRSGGGGGGAARCLSAGDVRRGEVERGMEIVGGEEGGEEERERLIEEDYYYERHLEATKHLSIDARGDDGRYYEDDVEEDLIDTDMMYPDVDHLAASQRGKLTPQVIAALSVSLGSMMIGFSTAYTSPALASMAKEGSTLHPTEQEESWIGGLMPLAALVGGVVGGPLIEGLGRRNTIIGTAVPFIVAWLLIAMANSVGMVLGGRAVAGFCVGIGSLSLPVYLGETIQPEVRGTLGLLPTALGNIGILICFVVGTYLDWSQLAIFGSVLPVPFLICMFLIPETPRWYISKNRSKEARKALQWLRGKDTDISAEFHEMENSNAENDKCPVEPEEGLKNSRCSSVSVSSLFDLFSPTNARPLIISVGLMFFQQMSGINAVIFYTVTIFKEAGTSLDENLCTIVVGVVNFMSTFVATALIDRLGRKVLLNVSGVSMIISLLALGGFFFAKDTEKSLIKSLMAEASANLTLFDVNDTMDAMANETDIFNGSITLAENATSGITLEDLDFTSSLASWSWLPLTAFVVYVIGFSIGFGPIPWLMMGEVLPAKIRGSAASLATAFNWSCTFIVTKTFRDLLSLLGAAAVFWLFGAFVTVGLVFVFFIVPETQGRSLEEIEMILTGRKKDVQIPAGYDKKVPVRRMSSIANLKPLPMGV